MMSSSKSFSTTNCGLYDPSRNSRFLTCGLRQAVATTAYWAKRASSIFQYGPVAEAGIGPHPKLPNVGMGGVKQQAKSSSLPAQVPASPRRSSTSQRNEEFASKQSSGS